MYALDRNLERAWQTIFDLALPRVDASLAGRRELVFDHAPATLLDPGLLIGQTCGYPLMTRYRNRLVPVCVAAFDVPGCQGKLYRSHFIVNSDSGIASLADCHGGVLAFNAPDSNSGMNVLRHALAGLGARAGFFSRVIETGAHAASVAAVAAGSADLAAIDCVSFHLLGERNPALLERVRIIASSRPTCGLPFVVPRERASAGYRSSWIEALNRAARRAPRDIVDMLHLRGFEAVTLADYAPIIEMESEAVAAGYPELK